MAPLMGRIFCFPFLGRDALFYSHGVRFLQKLNSFFWRRRWAAAVVFTLRNMAREEVLSIASNGEMSGLDEVSDSNSSSHPSPATKHSRSCGNETTQKFKGVVPQHNGHWGCQIYYNHQRIWLGTFKSEKDAAMAYDSAALKLRSGVRDRDLFRNFPLTEVTAEEQKFQSYYSIEAVLQMIKEGTYQSKLDDFIKSCNKLVETELSLKVSKAQSSRGLFRKQLFKKVLTPSDVGKLNRLVIPKKFAEKFFPRLPESDKENATPADKSEEVQVACYDRSMQLWRFRYCYWNSSQSYVFTRGWNRFVRAKQLNAEDTISFSLCESRENLQVSQTFYMIDVEKTAQSGGTGKPGVTGQSAAATETDLGLRLGQDFGDDNIAEKMEEEKMRAKKPKHVVEGEGFKLFGIKIVANAA